MPRKISGAPRPFAGRERRYEAPKAKTSWDSVAPWYDEHLASAGTYQTDLLLPHMMRIVDPGARDVICDIGCGQGFFSRAFARSGARVIGVDASPRLIDAAKRQGGDTISYFTSSADSMRNVATASCTKAVIILALQNMERAQDVLVEASRILAPGGKLFIVLNHPAFRIPKESSWGWDEKERAQYRRVDGYYNEWKIKIQMHPGDAPHITTVSFHRPLQYYIKALRKAGFLVAGLEEWISNRKSQKGPRQVAEDKARKEIPLFMEIEAVKV